MKYKTLNCLITEEQAIALREKAHQENKSQAEILREMLFKYLKLNELPKNENV